MKKLHRSIILAFVLSMFGTKAFAYDIAVENADGVTIYYNYINNGTELEVAQNYYQYSDYEVVNIPETVTYMNRKRSVTSIGNFAFKDCYRLISVTIPNSVATIGNFAFNYCSGLTSVTIPNSVFFLGDCAFEGCSGLTSVTIPNSVTSIGGGAFKDCHGLTSVSIPNSVKSIGADAFMNCRSLTSVTIPNSVTSIEINVFAYCSALASVAIPNSVTSIGYGAFNGCSSLSSVTIPNSVTSIGDGAFQDCSALTSVTIPNSVTSIGNGAFSGWDVPTVVSLIENPFVISNNTFSNNTFKNATLYVPVGTIDKYKVTDGWKDFLFIEEGTGGEGPATPERCEKPAISYQNGKLTFVCSTEGATCQYCITDTDVKAGSGNEIDLTVTYVVNVYATKVGYENSDVVSATLCWIDVEPKMEGITGDVTQVRANAVLIQAENGRITVSGVDDGKKVCVYSTNGVLCGTASSYNGSSTINTSLQVGSIAIVKIGEKSVKVTVK